MFQAQAMHFFPGKMADYFILVVHDIENLFLHKASSICAFSTVAREQSSPHRPTVNMAKEPSGGKNVKDGKDRAKRQVTWSHRLPRNDAAQSLEDIRGWEQV